MVRRWLVVAALAVACSRPKPSPEYERAREQWTALVREVGDAAPEDPRADEILALLAGVPKDSLDASSAAELAKRIEDERSARAAERARREKLVAGAGVPPAMPPSSGSGGEAPPPAPTGPPRLAPGMKLEDFVAAYGECFASKGPVQIGSDAGAARDGEMWTMKDDGPCREKYPPLAGQAVLFSGGELVGVSPASSARRVVTQREVELGRFPDGGLGMKVDGGVVPLPPGATFVVPDAGSR